MASAASSAPPPPDPLECAVCHEILESPITAACGIHNFCSACLRSWIRITRACPTCRAPMPAIGVVNVDVAVRDAVAARRLTAAAAVAPDLPALNMEGVITNDEVLGETLVWIIKAGTWLGTPVAVGGLRAGLPATVAEQAERDARALSRYRHPHIAAAYGIARGADGGFVVVTQRGARTLADELARCADAGGLPIGQLCDVSIGVARALAHLHAKGVVYRDLNLSNVLLTEGGDALLSCFSIAEPAAAADAVTSTRHTTADSSVWLAPEQCDPANVPTPSTDMYALGVMMTQLATGAAPYGGVPLARVGMATPVWVRPPVVRPGRLDGLVSQLMTDLMSRVAGWRPSARGAVAVLRATTHKLGPGWAAEEAERALRGATGVDVGRALIACKARIAAITTLDASSRALGDDGACALADTLRSLNVPQLTTLNVSGNNMGEAGARALAGTLRYVPSLTTLSVGHCRPALGTIRTPADFEHHKLHARATANSIGEGGARALAAELRYVPRLTTLDMDGNAIGEGGASALAAELHYVPLLTTLNVDDNAIGEAGARALAEALHFVPLLKTLNLGGNDIGDGGVQALAGALQHVPNLKELNLNGNRVGEDGAVALADSLQFVQELKCLHVGGNNFASGHGSRALAEALRRFVPKLMALTVSSQPPSRAAVASYAIANVATAGPAGAAAAAPPA